MKPIPSSGRSGSLRETARTAAVVDGLQTLRRGLSRAGGFTLFVAVCNKASELAILINMLAESLPGKTLHTVRLDNQTSDPLDQLLSQVVEPTGPVVLMGLDQTTPLDQSVHETLRHLNLQRPQWAERVRQPVVLGVPESALGVAAYEAPDFLDWRSDTIIFPDLPDYELQPLREHIWPEIMRESHLVERRKDQRLTLEQAREHALSVLRQAEEERRLLAEKEAEIGSDLEEEAGS